MTPQTIIRHVSRITKVPVDLIQSPSREAGTGDARALVVWAIYQANPNTRNGDVSELLGTDQSLVSRAKKRASDLYDGCAKFRKMRDELGRLIKAKEVAA